MNRNEWVWVMIYGLGGKIKEREDINANPIVFVFFSMSVETTMARFQ